MSIALIKPVAAEQRDGERAGDQPSRSRALDQLSLDFTPGLLQIQQSPPSPLPKLVLRGLIILLAALLAWAMFGRSIAVNMY